MGDKNMKYNIDNEYSQPNIEDADVENTERTKYGENRRKKACRCRKKHVVAEKQLDFDG